MFIHAKICIIDDTFARVGSANLTNRSLGLDTECDLAIESGGNTRIEAAIARFRNRLLGEHLGLAPERVGGVAAEGSVLTVVDSLRAPSAAWHACRLGGCARPKASSRKRPSLIPRGPIDPTEVITRALPTEAVRHSCQPVVRLAIVLGLLVLLGPLALDTAPRLDLAEPPRRVDQCRRSLAACAVRGGRRYRLGSLLMIPLTLLILQAAFILARQPASSPRSRQPW